MDVLFGEIGLWLFLAIAALLGILLIPYVLTPLLVYFTTRISGRPRAEEFYLEDPDVPRAVLRYVDDALEDLESDGFAVLGAFYVSRLVANVRTFAVLVGKMDTKDLALIAVVYADGLGVQMKQSHVEFSTSFAGGGAVDTSNIQEVNIFVKPPGHVVNALPWIQDVRQLYRIHRAIINRERRGAERAWHVGDDPAAYLEKNLVEELSRQVPLGTLYRDAKGDFRPTIVGSIRFAFCHLWPVKSILLARRRSRGEKLLRELKESVEEDNDA